jgi:WD40 repeat protein
MSFSSVAKGFMLAARRGDGAVTGEHGRPDEAVRQDILAGRDVYTAGRDLVINQAPVVRYGQPDVDSWVAAIYAAADEGHPLGSGVVIDGRRVLTCAHVVMKGDEVRDEVWVAFPMADQPAATRWRVGSVSVPDDEGFNENKDVALLELEEPVPDDVTPARLRHPKPKSLVGERWWAFGFPQPRGSASGGTVESALADGWVRLEVRSSFPIEPGFSGTGLWSPDRQAVVGIVGLYNDQRYGQALTIHQADKCLPGHGLRELADQSHATDSGEIALTAWGWTLMTDPEGRRHWRPRARGVSVDSERGYRFRGRKAALTSIRDWLDRSAPDRKVLVVTGAPGAGKSAVLGRIVTTADKAATDQLPRNDTAVRATTGSVACAVHAKSKTALEIAQQIAEAASAAIPHRISDFPTALRDALSERAGPRFNVVIDALDEARTPAEARTVIAKVILPLAETCADVGAQVVVGARRSDLDGDLLTAFGESAKVVDLDKPEFFAEEDLAAYALAMLQLEGDERADNPYADDAIANPVATRIARLSGGNFLVAGLTARTHGLHDETAADPRELTFSSHVDDAMREYLSRIPDMEGVSAETLLLPLAYAESPGLPVPLWRVAVKALDMGDVPEVSLRRFARLPAASYLLESAGGDGEGAAFRLFHQALNDALLRERSKVAEPRDDERALTRTFLATGQEAGWNHAPAYLLRALPGHAARAGLMDELLADDYYLLFADLLRVQPLANQAKSMAGLQRERLLRLSHRNVLTAGATIRAALFSVTEVLEDLPRAYTEVPFSTPYRGAWAATAQSREHSVLRHGDSRVTIVCAFILDGTTHLATASDDGTIRIWDPATGTLVRTLAGKHWINAICPFAANDTTLLAVASYETIHIWDPTTGNQLHTLTGHERGINAIWPFTLNGTTLLAVSSYDNTIRIWNPSTGTRIRTLTSERGIIDHRAFILNGTLLRATARRGTVRIWNPADDTTHEHKGWIDDPCALPLNGVTYLATTSHDGSIRIWDPTSGATRRTITTADNSWVTNVCPFTLNGTTYLATTSYDGTVRIWDPAHDTIRRIIRGHEGKINAICAFTLNGTTLLATASNDKTVRIWNPAEDTRHRASSGHAGQVGNACPLPVNGTTILATASEDATVKIWDATTGAERWTLKGHKGWVRTVWPVPNGGTAYLASSGDDGCIRIWNLATGREQRRIEGHVDDLWAVCPFVLDDSSFLATASYDNTLRIWNLATGGKERSISGHEAPVYAISAFALNGTTRLATASYDNTLRIWNPATGAELHTIAVHDALVSAICAFVIDGTTFLATVGDDCSIRIWDPDTGTKLRAITGHEGWVRGVCPLTLDGTTLLATAGEDRSVRIWDPAKGTCALVVPTRDPGLSVAYADGLLFVGTTTGVLTMRLDTEFLRRSLR